MFSELKKKKHNLHFMKTTTYLKKNFPINCLPLEKMVSKDTFPALKTMVHLDFIQRESTRWH